MKKYNSNSQMGSKATVGILVCSFVAVIAVAGTYTVSKFQENVEKQLEITEQNIAEKQAEKEGLLLTEITNASDILNAPVEVEDTQVTLEETSGNVVSPNLSFHADSTLMWPVDGGVLMRYSMEQSIYFETLDQYKRNDAMVIESVVGEDVLNAQYGLVISIEDTVEYGKTVTLDLGDGYLATYGQLENIKVANGNIVEKGQILGTIAEPSRYYTLEGPNLYFQLSKDGEAIDPLEFLE